MKILAIRIKNLASLEGLHEIDFNQEPLLSSGIFAITGPTGAGKSTILDALCLALYAKTPRYIQAKESGVMLKDVDGTEITQGDSRSILRDGTAEGFAEVDFVGKDGKKYRSRWSTYRAGRKTTGKLQSYNIELIAIETKQNLTTKLRETLEKIAALIGLNFEQFTKSVLLAQGEFTAFLKADKDQKASLLEKLTGTEIYSRISERVYSNYTEQKNKLKTLREQADNVQLLSPEQLEEIHLQLKEISFALEENKNQINSVNEQLTAFQELKKLEERIVLHQQAHQLAQSEKENARDRQAQIMLIERLQPVHHLIKNEQVYQKEIALLNQNISESRTLQTTILAAIEKLKIQSAQIREQSDLHQKRWSAAQPLFKKAQTLDVRAAEKATFKEKQLAEVLVIEKQQQEQKILTEEIEKQFLQSQNELVQVQRWLNTHQSRASIALHQQLILSKLEDASRWATQMLQLQTQLNESETSIFQNQLLLESETGQIKLLSQQSDALKLQIASVEEDLKLISPEQLSKEQKTLQTQQIELVQADKILKDRDKIRKESKDLQEEISKNELEISTQNIQLAILKNEIQTDEIVLKNTNDLVQKIRMETSESVEKLRAQLTPGHPCPVCGNTGHPYSEMHPAESSALNILEKELEEKQQYLLDKQQNMIRLTEKIPALEKQILLAKEKISAKRAEAEDLQTEWKKLPLLTHLTLSESLDLTSWLVANRLQLEQVETALEKHRMLSESFTALQRQKSELEQQEKSLAAKISNIEKLLLSVQERQTTVTRSLSQLNEQTQEVREFLQPYFNQADWFQNWKKQPGSFTEMLKKFSSEWNLKKEQSEKLQQLIRETENEIKNQKILLEAVSQTILQKKNELDFTEKEIRSLQNERNQIFEGRALAEVESEFQQQSEYYQSAFDASLKDLQSQEKSLTAIETSLQLNNQSLQKTRQLAEQAQATIQQWLTQQQLSYPISELSQILDYSQEWYTEEKQYLHQVEDRCKSEFSLLQQAQKNRQEHIDSRKWENSEEEISAQKNLLQSTADSLLQTQFRLKSDVERDEKEKKSKEQLFKKIAEQENITYEWERLNDLIGSAKGDKFKQLAQEYTLDILTDYSNVHLQSLSKRYLLQRIPGTLALQVKDLDMGEEVRSVYSLSGGESFLVSLGLALGLASLSSNRMRVESLFIDEGFGSLDPHTLNIAMDALENLYQQGRKVGVISHVQEMTERIPVQIKVSKLNTGRSTVEVIG